MSYTTSYTTYYNSNTTDSALTLLRISNNIIAVAMTLIVFLYFQMILETCMIDQHFNFLI